jgi:hypothetical protein
MLLAERLNSDVGYASTFPLNFFLPGNEVSNESEPSTITVTHPETGIYLVNDK